MGPQVSWPLQWKEVECHRQNYNQHNNAMSLRIGDTVLVCVTTFRGSHKIQSRWVNREYVMEWQPYPNLWVCLVHPIDGEGCRHTLHRNYLLPTSSKLEQGECENSVGEVETVIHQLQFHMKMTHCQSTTWPKVDWTMCLIHLQNSTNHLTQGQLHQPAWVPQMKGSKLTMTHLFH